LSNDAAIFQCSQNRQKNKIILLKGYFYMLCLYLLKQTNTDPAENNRLRYYPKSEDREKRKDTESPV